MSYLKLNQTSRTSFQWEGQTFTVADAPAPIFDAFVSQIYEVITDLDRSVWDIYARWDILNDAIGYGDMRLVKNDDETFLLEVVQSEEEVAEAEENASGVEAFEVASGRT